MKIEWPTIGLALVIYGAWLGLTWVADSLPLIALVPLGGLICAWHGSLQHEITHGHPTGSRAINRAIAGPPLSLWLPFAVYRDTHIEHHRADEIADPARDPESFYLAPDTWDRSGRARRAVARVNHTLVGRMLLGPPLVIAATWRAELCRARLATWIGHALAVAAVMVWVVGVCGLHPLIYIAAFVYPGMSLTLLRSFAEHRPGGDPEHRNAVVEAHPLWAALFLNNNLHAVHHADPRRPWYRLPARYRAERAAILAANGGYLIRGYGELVRRYAIRVKGSPVHPGGRPC